MIYWQWFGSEQPDARKVLATWAAKRIWPDGSKDLAWFGEQLCLGVFDGDDVIAVMVYHNYEPEAGVIEISGAALSARWLTRPVLTEMYRYAFEEVGVQLVVQRTPAENGRLLSILRRLGFEFYRIPRLRGRDRDETICTLTDDAWLNSRFSQKDRIVGKTKSSKAA